MPKTSAGLLMYRRREGGTEVFLVHPGGPFYARKDDGVWSIPKGEPSAGEDALSAARREFVEETGFPAPAPKDCRSLGEIRMKTGKVVSAWAFEGDADPDRLSSGTFEMEWPPRSGRRASFPEVDRGAFFGPEAVRRKVHPDQVALLDRLQAMLSDRV
jgi:predicted NUDIX family NTP pyrophosphohydrolase